eukprot:scaffold100706_cov31-Tisochrysis_lutea.AAC.5
MDVGRRGVDTLLHGATVTESLKYGHAGWYKPRGHPRAPQRRDRESSARLLPDVSHVLEYTDTSGIGTAVSDHLAIGPSATMGSAASGALLDGRQHPARAWSSAGAVTPLSLLKGLVERGRSRRSRNWAGRSENLMWHQQEG